MTGLGVGLGVALLLAAASTPALLDARADRRDARSWLWATGDGQTSALRPADATVLIRTYSTTVRGKDIGGVVLRPDDAHPPIPPGLAAVPGPGQMAVSPALARLLDSRADGPRLATRLPYQRAATIGPQGLTGPNELFVYIGAPGGSSLRDTSGAMGRRIDHFGVPPRGQPMPALLTMLIVVLVVVLLLPVGAFTAGAVRFGAEARDRQLAALRLLGADLPMARRIAAGGALAGALAGCAVGAALFAAGRQLVERVTLFDVSMFAQDVRPDPTLTVVVLAAVPASAVLITLFSLRRVMIEPLGVVRRAARTRRRLWWRCVLPVVGVLLLLPLHAGYVPFSGREQAQLTVGVLATLVGVTVLLPWVVDAVVRRLGAGPASWQLAVRRLQLDSATTVRAVAAISVAVAGAIALQMVFSVAEDASTRPLDGRGDLARAMVGGTGGGDDVTALRGALARGQVGPRTWALAEGTLRSVDRLGADQAGEPLRIALVVADCPTLLRLAETATCQDDDLFLATPAEEQAGGGMRGPAPVVGPDQLASPETARLAAARTVLPGPGVRMRVEDPGAYAADGGEATAMPGWTMAAGAISVTLRTDTPAFVGILATPAAVPADVLAALRPDAYVDLDRRAPGSLDTLRDAVAMVDPLATVSTYDRVAVDPRFAQIRTSMYGGIVVMLGVVGASLLVTMVEQLRERRRVLAVLVAFGTRRRTLAASVLWQAALPMALGVALAIGVGVGLGAALLRMVGQSPAIDWANIGAVSATAAAVALATTAASLPALYRLMCADGLRME